MVWPSGTNHLIYSQWIPARLGTVSELINKLRTLCAIDNLLPPGSTLVLAVSGGLDSMVLLHLVQRLREEYSWRVVVAHYNHRLRGSESDLDAEFVKAAALTMGLPFFTEAGDVRSFAKANSLSVEMAARELRHQFLAKTAKNQQCDQIVLAHHADDQAELFWIRMLRGTWGAGLSGMRSCSPSPADKTIHLIRPLLHFSRQELVLFAQETNVSYREDSSNQDLSYQRNRVRHCVLPILQEASKRPVPEITLRFMQLLAEQQSFLEDQAEVWQTERHPDFVTLHPALQRQLMHAALIQHGLKPSTDLIEHLLHHPDVAIRVTGDIFVHRTTDGDLVCREPSENALPYDQSTQTLALESQIAQAIFGDFQLTIRRSSSGPDKFTDHPAWFDARTLPNDLLLRHWQPGDKFHKIGMEKPTKLQDVFVNAKIPFATRRKLVLVAQRDGPIVWVESVGVGSPYKVTLNTIEFLEWKWRKVVRNPEPE